MTNDGLKIRELRVRAVKVPMTHPHRTASGTIAESPLVLTDVLTEEGVVGHSYVFCYGALALKPTALLVKALEPLIAGTRSRRSRSSSCWRGASGSSARKA